MIGVIIKIIPNCALCEKQTKINCSFCGKTSKLVLQTTTMTSAAINNAVIANATTTRNDNDDDASVQTEVTNGAVNNDKHNFCDQLIAFKINCNR